MTDPPGYEHAEGLDMSGTLVWIVKLIRDPTGPYWLGTGRDQLFFVAVDLPQALSHYIRSYPGTSRIRIVGDRRYHDVDLSEATHKLVIDGIMEKISDAG